MELPKATPKDKYAKASFSFAESQYNLCKCKPAAQSHPLFCYQTSEKTWSNVEILHRLKLQTWQRITYGQLYHKCKVTVPNPAGLLHQNRMRLSSSSHWKNEAIYDLEDSKLQGGMFEDFSLINSNRFYYPLPPVLLLVLFIFTLY